MKLSAPVPLSNAHKLEDFQCTEPTLEAWLKQRALANQTQGASRCYVVGEAQSVVGYCALAAGALWRPHAPSSIRRNMPESVPVVVLGRLAVHKASTGQGIGAGLLKDAVARSVRLSWELGIRALLCHAISEDAKRFYLHHGFIPSPIEPMTLLLKLSGHTGIKAVPDETGGFDSVHEPKMSYVTARKKR